MVAVRVVVRGRVQGVGFRASCQRAAEHLGVAGWVRNVDDGTVEAHLEGPSEPVEQLVSWCGRGPAPAAVTGVRRRTVALEGLDGFEVR